MGKDCARCRLHGRQWGDVNTSAGVLLDRVVDAVRKVVDPELGGVTIGDLGLVHQVLSDVAPLEEAVGAVIVELLPTFLGCPALTLMAADVKRAALGAGATACSVEWKLAPRWDSSRISPSGIEQLASLGIAVARADRPEPACPSCGRAMLRPVNPVGATACRAVAWCGGCRSVIDVMGAERS